MVVLGAFPEYLEEASRRGGGFFAPSARAWRFFVNTGDHWTMCESYLNASRRAGQEFLLATNPATISLSSIVMMELTHLLQHGFRLGPDGDKLLPGDRVTLS